MSIPPNGKASMQVRATKKMKNSWHFSCITAQTKYVKERASEQNNILTKIWKKWQQKHKVEIICNNAIYARKSESSHLPGLYCLIL